MTTTPQSTQIVNEAALAVTRSAARATQATINANMDTEANSPLRLYGSNPTDSKLHIGASQVSGSDGTGKSTPPQSGTVNNAWTDTTVDFGVTSGWISGGTVTRDGATFSLPTITAGRFLRVAFVFTTAGTVDCTASDGSHTSKGTLPNPGTLFASLSGSKIGWIDLVALTGGQTYKTADSSGTASIIENAVGGTAQIVKFGSSASDGGAQAPLVLQSATTPNVTIAGGYLSLADGRELTTTDGGTDTANYGKQYTFSATAIQSPAASTVYHFYIDLDTLGSQVTIATGTYTGRKIYTVTSSNIAISTTGPDSINRARYVWMGVIKTTSGSAWSGTGASLAPATRMEGLNSPISISPVVYRLAKQTVGTVGTSGQVAAGHTQTVASFPSLLSTASYAFFGLAAGSGTDGNATNNLTANGTPTTGSGVTGSAGSATTLNGTSQYFSSTAAFFDLANTNASFAVGGWFKANDWTPSAAKVLWSQAASASDLSFEAMVETTGDLSFRFTNTAASYDLTVTVSNPGFTDATFHHIAVVRADAAGTVKIYIDGKLAASDSIATIRGSTADTFVVGARFATAANFFAGVIDEFFAVKAASLTDRDIRRLYAARIDHSTGVSTTYQDWDANIYDDTDAVGQDSMTWLVDKTSSNSLFVDFGDLRSTDSVELALRDTGISAVAISSVAPFDQIYTAAPTSPQAHGQPDIPDVIILQETGSAGVWAAISAEGKVTVDSTNITYLDTFPTPAASPNRVWVIARTRRLATVSVPDANSARSGVVTTSQQDWNGLKRLLSGAAVIGNIRASEGAGTTALTDADNRQQTFALTAARTVTLPTTNIVAGDLWILENTGNFDLTVNASGGANVETIRVGHVYLRALVNTPTTAAHWLVENVQESISSITITVDTNVDSSQALALSAVRNNKAVTVGIFTTPGIGSNTTGATLSSSSTSEWPTRLRPATRVFAFILVGGTGITSNNSPMLQLGLTGLFSFYKDANQSNFALSDTYNITTSSSWFTYNLI